MRSLPVIAFEALVFDRGFFKVFYNSTMHVSSARPVSLSDKRRIVYASLLEHSPETKSLRERAFDTLVLSALMGSGNSADTGYQLGKIKENLRENAKAVGLRDNIIQGALARLALSKQIESGQHKKRNVYWLADVGEQKISALVQKGESLLTNVIDKVLANAPDGLDLELGKIICRKFIINCFSEYGERMAQGIAGGAGEEVQLGLLEFEFALSKAIADADISIVIRESLAARLQQFLRSKDIAEQTLKFNLVQGYYFTELICAQNALFNPLSADVFSGADFYLDTNVVLIAILESRGSRSAFGEMAAAATTLGITLRVTQETLLEIHNVAIDRIAQIRKFDDIIPDSLARQTDDQFLQAYLQMKEEAPAFTIDDFSACFEDLEGTLSGAWGVRIEPACEDFDISKYKIEADTIQEEAGKGRRGGKPPDILAHDVYHYVLIRGLRATNPKTWFLTRDRGLAKASQRLLTSGKSVCFPLTGFLHSISPFIEIPDGGASFADVFSDVLSMQAVCSGTLYDVKELALIAECHSDVLGTAPDQLLLAFEYVKSKCLEGGAFDTTHVPAVSLELKKFLTSSKDERLRNMENERRRVEDACAQALRAKDKLEQDALVAAVKLAKVRADADRLAEDVAAGAKSSSDLGAALKKQAITIKLLSAGLLLVSGFISVVFSLMVEGAFLRAILGMVGCCMFFLSVNLIAAAWNFRRHWRLISLSVVSGLSVLLVSVSFDVDKWLSWIEMFGYFVILGLFLGFDKTADSKNQAEQ